MGKKRCWVKTILTRNDPPTCGNAFPSRRTICSRTLHWSSVIILLPFFLWGIAAPAQGGPPFRTDDPETPGNQHWEINFGWIGDRNPAAGDYQVPDFDINYGLGDRIQLKYEIPIAIAETRSQNTALGEPARPGHVIGGIGESLLGIKWRFYEHHPTDPLVKNRFGTGLLSIFNRSKAVRSGSASPGAKDTAEPVVDFSVSTYPQLFLDNPTRAVQRGLVEPGPAFFLPLEVNGRIGPIRYDGEIGYNFGNQSVPQSWGRGLLLGHEFGERTEAYIELYDQQDANRIGKQLETDQSSTRQSKQRETTLGLGGRQSLNKSKTWNLLLMAGRSFQTISASNSQPSWIAYVGVQVLLGPRELVTPQVEQKLPAESKH